MADPTAPQTRDGAPAEAPGSIIPQRLRAARMKIGMSARQLALQLGCSPSLISQIERGKATPSVSRLYAIATALGTSIDSFFPDPAPGPAEEQPESTGIVLRRGDRPALDLEHGVRWERLTPHTEQSFEFREVFYDAGGGSPGSERAIQHNGRDYAVIIEGELRVQVGFERWLLAPGDSCAFDATIPHRFWNQGRQRVRAVFALLDIPEQRGGRLVAAPSHDETP